MKLIKAMLVLFLALAFIQQSGFTQVTAVKYQLRYNTTNCRYDCYLVIISGSATSATHRAQFNSQLSFVVPTGTNLNVAQNYMPLQSNQSYTGTNPLIWQKTSVVIAPAITPGSDYISITPTLSPTSFYNDIFAGDSIRLFSLSVSPVQSCGLGIRFYENGVDPTSSDPGMGGGDFSNGFTVGGTGQKYTGNLAQVGPPKPTLGFVTGCSTGLEITLTVTATSCQTPYTYQWTGPNGYSGTTKDVSIPNATSAANGIYMVTVTGALGCTATGNVVATSKPNAGADVNVCAGGNKNLTGTNPTTGTWSAKGTNPAGATLGPTNAGVVNVSFSVTANGNYNFIYTSGACSDTVMVTSVLPDAGPDPAQVGCFSSGSASMNASGTGIWTLGISSAGTANIANPSNPTSTVSGFSVPGTYYLIWTVNGCQDIAEIIVNNNCSCSITSNTLPSVNPSVFCGNSGLVNITGPDASPSGGTYNWIYGLNGGSSASASGTSNLKDYTTPNLLVGSHRYRRIYVVNSGGPVCSDTSNVILLDVNTLPSSPSNLVANPSTACVGNTINLSVTNNAGALYTWTASSPNAGIFTSNINTTTMVPLQAGTYTISVTQTINGCTSNATTLNVTVNSAPPTPSAGNTIKTDPTMCGSSNGSINFTSLPINAIFTVQYTKNLTLLSASISSNGSGVAVLTGLSAGSYSDISLTNVSGCKSGTYAGPINISDPNTPATPINIQASPNPTCANTTINLSVDNNAGATYNWTASSSSAGLVSSSTNSQQ